MNLLALQQDFRAWLTNETAELPQPGHAVYINNYRSQLLSCLSASYPVTRAWIGETAFGGAAAHHIDLVPPHGWTLDAYGLDFSRTLELLYPDDLEVAEIARLECELAVAFLRADAEPVDLAALADIDWDSAAIHLSPTFATLRIATNVAAIWSSIIAGETPPAAMRLSQPAVLAVWRQNFAPRFRTLSVGEADVLARVQNGETFGTICTGLASQLGPEQGAAIAGSFLSQWFADGLVVRITCN